MSLFDVKDDELIRNSFDDCELPMYDRNNLTEIRKKLDEDGYSDISEIDSHEELLEDMTNRLRMIVNTEKSIGAINWEIEKYITEAHDLYQRLESLKQQKLLESQVLEVI